MEDEESVRIDQQEYDRLFKTDKKLLGRALTQAYEIRKFEIELYWKRAAYFWAFIGASFVGYGTFLGKDQEHALLLTACIGFVFSVAWHCVNKGSKFWQENWENHVELLEDEVFGPLYKSLTERPNLKNKKWDMEKAKEMVTAPAPFSVSKINQLVSTYMAIVWGILLLASIGEIHPDLPRDWLKITFVGTSLVTCWLFWFVGKSHLKSHNPEVRIRKSAVCFEQSHNKPLNSQASPAGTPQSGAH